MTPDMEFNPVDMVLKVNRDDDLALLFLFPFSLFFSFLSLSQHVQTYMCEYT